MSDHLVCPRCEGQAERGERGLLCFFCGYDGPARGASPREVRLDVSRDERYSLYIDHRLAVAGSSARVRQHLAGFTPRRDDRFFVFSFQARYTDLLAALAESGEEAG